MLVVPRDGGVEEEEVAKREIDAVKTVHSRSRSRCSCLPCPTTTTTMFLARA